MKKTFADLSEHAQVYINERFGHYNISGEDAFEHIFSDEMRELSSDQIAQLLMQKDISHIISQSNSPDLASNLDNIFLEDIGPNRSRGAENVTDEELSFAWDDQISDVEFVNANESTFDFLKGELENIDNTIPIEDILGGSFIFGTVFTGVETYKAIENNEIELNDAPKFFLIKTGGKTVKIAIIGMSLASSSPIIVSAGVGYLIYKNKFVISKVYNSVYGFLANEKTREYATLAYNGTISGISEVGEYTYTAMTSDTTKNALNKTRNSIENTYEGSKKILNKWLNRKK
ncbi:hypothetical protein ITJ86_16995 [Winogradskyella sp. F6397]|uniref:Uncharacterized protein n=1 Tax=Winogradskyella marina TaxID=2785530 RepID=A0ABS0ES55_9FLAO|nr:hypothetical protein [Winogradskyella marina]MBF8151601.1 hypothetical protein [Winogradskyella marina]